MGRRFFTGNVLSIERVGLKYQIYSEPAKEWRSELKSSE